MERSDICREIEEVFGSRKTEQRAGQQGVKSLRMGGEPMKTNDDNEVMITCICPDESTVNKYIDNNVPSSCKPHSVLFVNDWISEPTQTRIDTGAAFFQLS